jgi:hypothetical protein
LTLGQQHDIVEQLEDLRRRLQQQYQDGGVESGAADVAGDGRCGW